MGVTRRRGRRHKKLLDDLKDRRGYSHLKEESLDRTMWRNRFGGDFGPCVRQNTERMNETSICRLILPVSVEMSEFSRRFLTQLYIMLMTVLCCT